MRALLLYAQSTHARDITTESMSEWEKEWNQIFGFFENSAKRRKIGKSQLFAVQTRIPQSSPKKKVARLQRPNFQFKKSIRIEKFEYRRLLDKYQSCLPEYIAWKQIWVLSKINYNFFHLIFSHVFSDSFQFYVCWDSIWIYVCWDSFHFYVYWDSIWIYVCWEIPIINPLLVMWWRLWWWKNTQQNHINRGISPPIHQNWKSRQFPGKCRRAADKDGNLNCEQKSPLIMLCFPIKLQAMTVIFQMRNS